MSIRGVVRAAGFAALVASAGFTAGQSSQDAGPAIAFVNPVDNDPVSGPAVVAVRVVPAGTAVRSVSLFADNKLLCTLESPPYQCPWDAGPGVKEHLVRATAVLGDGRTIKASIRTKAFDHAESVVVSAVRVTATVTGSRGRFIRGLKASDFRIAEDGVAQSITTFLSDNIPLEIVVAVDVSGSMTKAMPTVKAAVVKFLSKLRKEDVVTVVGFNDRFFIIARPTVSPQGRVEALQKVRPWGGTSLYDAMVKALPLFGTEESRRVIVVFTDGEDLDSRIPRETAERSLESNDAMLYAIGLGRAPSMESLRKVLERLSDRTGGQAFFENLDKLDEAFDGVLADLANQYLMGYEPQDGRRDGRWREIRVEVPGHDYRVRAKKGYRLIPK
jgi:Ca-activated chloride channel homolog